MRKSELLCVLVLLMVGACGRAVGESKVKLDYPRRFNTSPKYGVTTSLPPAFDAQGRLPQYVVRFDGLGAESTYQVVDSFFSGYMSVACDSSTVAFLDRDSSHLWLTTLELEGSHRRDKIVDLHHLCGPTATLEAFRYRRRDSLLVFSEYNIELPMRRTTITVVTGPAGLDTVDQLAGFSDPNMSGDGTEILLATSDPRPGGGSVPSVGIYDILSHSLSRPIESGFGVFSLCRRARNEPMFYARNNSTGYPNVWCLDPATGEHQITFLTPPEYAKYITLSQDSLKYKVLRDGASGSELVRVESLALADILRK